MLAKDLGNRALTTQAARALHKTGSGYPGKLDRKCGTMDHGGILVLRISCIMYLHVLKPPCQTTLEV